MDENDKNEDTAWDRRVVFPEPLSPLAPRVSVNANEVDRRKTTYKKITAWFSALVPRRVKARRARSSTSPAALPSFAPSGPLEAEV